MHCLINVACNRNCNFLICLYAVNRNFFVHCSALMRGKCFYADADIYGQHVLPSDFTIRYSKLPTHKIIIDWKHQIAVVFKIVAAINTLYKFINS